MGKITCVSFTCRLFLQEVVLSQRPRPDIYSLPAASSVVLGSSSLFDAESEMNWILQNARKSFSSLETGTLVPQRHNAVNWVIYYRDMVRTVTPSNSTHLKRFTCHLRFAVAERLEVNTSLLSQSPSANTPDNPRSMRRSLRGSRLCFRWWVMLQPMQRTVSVCFKKPSLDRVSTDPLCCHDSGHRIEPWQSPSLCIFILTIIIATTTIIIIFFIITVVAVIVIPWALSSSI